MTPFPGVDPESLARSIEALTKSLSDAPAPPDDMAVVERPGKRLCAVLLKRTYAVENGRCVPVSEEEQNPLLDDDVPYAELPPPRVSPLFAADDSLAFKSATDVIVQASAHVYSKGVNRTTVSVRFGKHEREIVVHGDRRGEIDSMGRPRFSEAEPIDEIPVRWDHAYGGFDRNGCERSGYVAILQQLNSLRPDWDAATSTPYHYPRNPAGCGYLTSLEARDFEGLAVPNLEHPGALLSPARMAVESPLAWMRAPLPAAWDFLDGSWFPRCAYLGLVQENLEDGTVPAEIKRGWCPADLLSSTPVQKITRPDQLRMEYAQVAAPGMSFPRIAPDERFELRNLHPQKPVHTIDLPGEVPRVHLELSPGQWSETTVFMNSVVIRVPLKEVEILWTARLELPAHVSEEDLFHVRRRVEWVRSVP